MTWLEWHIISFLLFFVYFFFLLLCKFVSWQRNRNEVITLFLYHHLLPPLPCCHPVISQPSWWKIFLQSLSILTLTRFQPLSFSSPSTNELFFFSLLLSSHPHSHPPLQSFSWGRHYIINLFVQQVLRHEEFEEGCKASCNGYLHESFLSFKIFFYTSPVLFVSLPPFLLTNFI
mgnify:CR=1 FL=1